MELQIPQLLQFSSKSIQSPKFVNGFQNYLEQVSTFLRVNIINGIRRSESEYITASLNCI